MRAALKKSTHMSHVEHFGVGDAVGTGGGGGGACQ